VRRDGRLLWADALALDGDIAATLDRPHGFAGATAMATALCAVPEGAQLLDAARERVAGLGAVRAGVTFVNGVLLARFLGPDAKAVRGDLTAYLEWLRAGAFSWSRRLPRVWYT
jgi:urease accessory protein